MVNKPIPYQAFVASAEARREAWRRKFAMDDSYAGARPGRGHLALAALHRAGKMPLLITQNIDGSTRGQACPTRRSSNCMETAGTPAASPAAAVWSFMRFAPVSRRKAKHRPACPAADW